MGNVLKGNFNNNKKGPYARKKRMIRFLAVIGVILMLSSFLISLLF